MKAYTLDQLMFAEAMAFPEDMQRLFDKHAAVEGCGFIYYGDWLKRYNRGLMAMIFNKYDRADLENGMGKMFEAIIDELIGDYKTK